VGAAEGIAIASGKIKIGLQDFGPHLRGQLIKRVGGRLGETTPKPFNGLETMAGIHHNGGQIRYFRLKRERIFFGQTIIRGPNGPEDLNGVVHGESSLLKRWN